MGFRRAEPEQTRAIARCQRSSSRESIAASLGELEEALGRLRTRSPLGHNGPRLQEVGSAEGRQEIVERHFVGQVGDVD